MPLPDLAERSKAFEPLASNVVYLAQYGENASASTAMQANARFIEVRALSTLTPTEALYIAGCPDAVVALDESRELDIEQTVADYFAADKADYIERNMLGALDRLIALLSRLDDGLREIGVPREYRPRWIIEGLDFPPGDGAARHVARTTLDRDAWKVAEERVDAFLKYVGDLPFELRTGEVDLDGFVNRIAEAVGRPD